ncbi:homeobox protein CDX-1-like [Acipenser ruthenus]|uniref:homeobox protein CDX-1-like n=1 Tax=Acipenser ruthenus TaxID=7906 RepID=UPI00145B3899|nr:homeobox protein CDX-1-like [Acipenser ruthenus]
MYVGYLLDKEVGMYHQGPVRRSGINMPAQNFVSTPQYSEYTGYHHVPNMDSHAQSSGTWGSPYATPREDWNAYGLGPSNALPTPMSSSSPAQVAYCSPDYNSMHPAGSGVLPPPPENITVGPPSPDSERHHSYDWMRKTVQSSSTGKTRTKEKYRVVYTDHQRLELEKEFHYNRYITIRRKSELASNLGLSERQVKIWFQNRRAKERKIIKKKMGLSDGSGGSVHSDPGSVSPLPLPGSLSPGINAHIFPPPGMNTLPPIGNLQQVTVTL